MPMSTYLALLVIPSLFHLHSTEESFHGNCSVLIPDTSTPPVHSVQIQQCWVLQEDEETSGDGFTRTDSDDEACQDIFRDGE